MATASWSPSAVSGLSNRGGYSKPWQPGNTDIVLSQNLGGYVRQYSPGAALNAVHDGCVVDSIKVEFTASQSVGLCDTEGWASFCGVTASKRALTTSSASYSAIGGAGTLPVSVRTALAESSCYNYDTFYDTSISMSHPIVTVSYTDNGIPYMLQFSL